MSTRVINRVVSDEVRDLSGRGTGLVDHPDGRVVFVPGVWPGDVGEFEIVREEKRYALGRLVRLVEKSASRVEPKCPHHGFDEESCWGCPWMMASYTSQVAFKEQQMRSLLTRAGWSAEVLKRLISSPDSYGYRNRAQLKSDGEKLGYVSPVTHEIVDVNECPILTLKNQATLTELRTKLPNPAWRPEPGEKWVSLNINEQVSAPEVAPGRELGFLQGNSSQNERMRQWLREQILSEPKRERALELFCGSGNFTEIFSECGFPDIVAIESSATAVDKLKEKSLPGVQALNLNLYKPQSLQKIRRLTEHPEVLLLDPPRAGFKDLAAWVRTFKSLKVVYYISCNPITFLRDAQSLREIGAHLEEVTPIDLFPHTPHIELMAKFRIS